jgi:hypothetical protein
MMRKNRTGFLKRPIVYLIMIGVVLSLMGCGRPQGGRPSKLEREARTEDEAADLTAEKLIKALEDKDAASVRELFSPYALENSTDLDEKIQEMFEYYPGMDGEYRRTGSSSRSSDYGTVVHIINPVISAEKDGKKYEINICQYLRNDKDSSMEGVYLIEIIKEEDEWESFKHMNEDDRPGVYVGE